VVKNVAPRAALSAAGLAFALTGAGAAAAPKDGDAFTDKFTVADADWTSTGRNPWFVLEPGYRLVLEGGGESLTITVLDETRVVDGVETRVVEERETRGGEVAEISRNFFAMSRRTGSVYYFGEEVDIYRGGQVSGHEGAWLSGKNGARYGLIMPGEPLIGARYYQEIAPGEAMDRAEIMSLGDTLETPAGKFTGCLRTRESSGIEPGREEKVYAPGIGIIKDGSLRLVRHGPSRPTTAP